MKEDGERVVERRRGKLVAGSVGVRSEDFDAVAADDTAAAADVVVVIVVVGCVGCD